MTGENSQRSRYGAAAGAAPEAVRSITAPTPNETALTNHSCVVSLSLSGSRVPTRHRGGLPFQQVPMRDETPAKGTGDRVEREHGLMRHKRQGYQGAQPDNALLAPGARGGEDRPTLGWHPGNQV